MRLIARIACRVSCCAELVATSRADESSLRALADVAEITADQNVRITGGQMTSAVRVPRPPEPRPAHTGRGRYDHDR